MPWLHGMWQGKPAAWFVQWEAIGHVQNHVGEMVVGAAASASAPSDRDAGVKMVGSERACHAVVFLVLRP